MIHELSPQMLKTLERIKKETIEEFDNMKMGATMRIVHKSTKHKTLTAVIVKITHPAFRLFVNDHFYGLYFLKNGKWESEK